MRKTSEANLYKDNKEDNWFSDNKDGLMYLHMEITPSTTVGYACRTTIEGIKKESIEKIKEEMFNYANQFTYTRDKSRNDCIIAKNKETGDETLFEDVDNMPEFIPEQSGSLNLGDNEILMMTPKEIEDQRVHGAENGLWCKYEDIPENLKNAFLPTYSNSRSSYGYFHFWANI